MTKEKDIMAKAAEDLKAQRTHDRLRSKHEPVPSKEQRFDFRVEVAWLKWDLPEGIGERPATSAEMYMWAEIERLDKALASSRDETARACQEYRELLEKHTQLLRASNEPQPAASNAMTLGRLVLETARGRTKERVLTQEEAHEIHEALAARTSHEPPAAPVGAIELLRKVIAEGGGAEEWPEIADYLARASQPPGPVQALIDAAIQWRKGPPNYYATNQALRDAVDAYSGSTKEESHG